MGTVSCKYCKCDKEKIEDPSKEMKMSMNSPIIGTNEKQDKEDNGQKDDNKEKDGNKENEEPNIQMLNKDKESCHVHKITLDHLDNNIIQISEKKNDNENNNQRENDKKEEPLIVEKKEQSIIIEKNDPNSRNNLKQSKINQFSIMNTNDAKIKVKNYEINKIQFGLETEDQEALNKEEKKLFKQAEVNLKQFQSVQPNEIPKIQSKMSNILYKLKNNFVNINNNDETILLNGTLKKMINYEINAHNPTMYSERFCILYPRMFKYYKSKIQFLKNLSPICVLPINQITAVNIAKPIKSNKKIYHIIICNKFGIQKSNNNSLFLNLFDSNEINDYLNSPEINESLVIFTSDDENQIYKWYIVFQTLLEYVKNNKNED